MKQRCKKATVFFSALLMGVVLIASIPMTAKAESLAESVQKMGKNKWYQALIQEQSRYDNQSDFKFDLVDVDADGVEDLIMTYKLTDRFTGVVYAESQLWSYNTYIADQGGYAPDATTIYYCVDTKSVKCVLEKDYGYKVSFGTLSIPAKEYVSYDVDKDGNYVTVDETTGTITPVTDEALIAEYDSWEKTYVPTATESVGKYEKTDAILDTYLPLGAVVETKAITLKVGEAYGLSMENIDKLLAESGYDYKSEPTAVPKLFYDDRVNMTAEYLTPASGVGVYDVSTSETIEMLYIAADDWTALIEEVENGTLSSKYGKEVGIVEEAEGFAYYARADKSGNAMITIPKYPISSDETIVVKIPVVIEAVAQEEGNDTSIVIDDANSILPTGTVLQSEKLESGEVFKNAENIVKNNVKNLVKYAIYELDLTDGNGAEVHQLDGKISVTMDLPFAMAENSTLKVYRLDNEKLVNCPAKVSNGKVTFETDHFSTYIFAEEAETAPQADNTTQMIIIISLIAAVVLVGGIVVFIMKSKKK